TACATSAQRKGSRKANSPLPSRCRGKRSTRSRRSAIPPRCPSRSPSPATSAALWRRSSMQITKTKWFMPLFAVALGALVFAAQWIGGAPHSGLVSFAILAGAGVLFLLGGRSETIRGLRGDGRDERFRRIDIHATALAGLAVIYTVIVMFVVELARGHNGEPYSWLGAIGGGTYITGTIIFSSPG